MILLTKAFWGIFFGTFILEDVALAASLALIASGEMSWLEAYLACFLGISVGDMGLYALGLGAAHFEPLQRWKLIRTVQSTLNQLDIHKTLTASIIVSRAIPGTRIPTYVLSGYVGYSAWAFLGLTILSVAGWVGLAFLGGQSLQQLFAEHLVVAIVLFFLFIYVVRKIAVLALNPWQRRAFWHSWRKWMSFEFWPTWLFYPPVVAYYMFLAVRYRSLFLPFYANPGILHGGFIGESKWEIYRHLIGNEKSLDTFFIPQSEEALHKITRWVETNQIQGPFILKPNVGQRGYGVRIIEGASDLKYYLAHSHFDLIVQQLAPGSREAGIFYYRFPNESYGHIFSITDKEFPVVLGDGARPLGRLILDDSRARIIARTYFSRFQGQLDWVPRAGEQVVLSACGNHCQGAIFLDGAELNTPELLKTIDSLAKTIPDFYIGRFDIRYTSIEELKRGENFHIVEVNGCSSEATHIWDPSTKLREAYSTLFEQWRILFKIGDQIRRKNLIQHPVQIRQLIADLRGPSQKPKALSSSS